MQADDSIAPSGAESPPQLPFTVSLSASRWSLFEKILHLLKEDAALILITGEPGIGKSYFLDCVAAHFLTTHKIIRLQYMTGSDVSQQIAKQLNLQCDPLDSAHLITKVHRELVTQLEPVLLLCDDAERYDDAALEQVRQFNNLGGTTTAALKIILCGNELLLNRLNNRRFDSLTQRIPIKLVLEPLDYPETASYITARTQTHFAIEQIPLTLTDRDIGVMYNQSKGIPQKLNGLVDTMLNESSDISVARQAKVKRPFSIGLIILALAGIVSFFVWFHLRAVDTALNVPQSVTPIKTAEMRVPVIPDGLKLDYAQVTHEPELEAKLQEGEHWLSSQAPDSYTMQLYLLLNPGKVTEPETHLVVLFRNGQKFYGVYQGAFPTASLAQQAVENLQAGQHVRRPLVKKIAEIQTEHSPQ